MHELDLQAKKTDVDIFRESDSFYLSFTPEWFKILEYVIVLGVISVFAEKYQSKLLWLTYYISLFLLWGFFQSFFFQYKFKNIPFIKAGKGERVASLIVSFLIALVVHLYIEKVVCIISVQENCRNLLSFIKL